MKKQLLALLLTIMLIAGVFAGCVSGKDESKAPESVDDGSNVIGNSEGSPDESVPSEPVTITIAGSWKDCRAIEEVGRLFKAKYPNCTVVYESLQDYENVIEKRMTGDEAVDIFFTTNIQSDSRMFPYALDLGSAEGLDLSSAFDGLIENFAFFEDGKRTEKLYAIPLGAEMRVLYVNKTLLDSLGIAIPTDQASLLAACETLKQNGYIPFHGNPSPFAQILLYPWCCSLIANASDASAVYNKIDAREEGVSELFRKPMEFMYKLIENSYYDYKTAQNLPFDVTSDGENKGLYADTTDEATVRYFLNIRQEGDSYVKADDKGIVAFMPSPLSLKSAVDKMKDDYHSNIEYAVIPAPVGEDGGYAYLSPAHGIAANKNSAKLEWSVKFLNFLFQPENNKVFAESFNIIPNTEEAFSYITSLYNIPESRISHVGQVTFGYNFYKVVAAGLLDVAKGNNPKYMQTDEQTGETTLYPLDYYMQKFEAGFKENG